MLVLSRKAGEGIALNQDISIEILSIEGDRVRIGIFRRPRICGYTARSCWSRR